MLILLALYLFLFSKASDSDTDDSLVTVVENKLSECLIMDEVFMDFLDVVEVKDDLRRRAEEDDANFATDFKKKLKICASILEAADAFRSHHFLLDLSIGFLERNFINNLLEPVSKKMGGNLYVASRDGDSGEAFHSACDDKGPTVVIVWTTLGTVFGGYTDVSWTSWPGFKTSSKSFLFQLRPYMKQYVLKEGEEKHAVHHYQAFGPRFGNGHDLDIRSGCMSGTTSYTTGKSYNFSASYELNDGHKAFKVMDYVVAKALAL